MENLLTDLVAAKTGISKRQVMAVVHLLEQGATIPFIARYRKEVTGNLDEEQIALVQTEHERFSEIAHRKESILSSIESQGQLSAELKKAIESTWDASVLEDLYLPYKPKKRTRAMIARENGLEPLSQFIFKQAFGSVEFEAAKYLNDKVASVEEALQGARDIIAETVNENTEARERIRQVFAHEAVITSKLVKTKKEEAAKYEDYFDYSEKLSKCPSHRLLAIRRAEREGLLRVDISPSEEKSLEILQRQFVKNRTECAQQVSRAVEDAYKRLLKPSIENEFASNSKMLADVQAIEVFRNNLRQLLLSPPLGEKRVLAIDPGYRTGCKVVCLDEQGNLLHNETIYPHKPQEERAQASKKLISLVSQYKIEVIAVGNGTAGRETEMFLKRLTFDRDLKVFMVSEDGASVYSASAVAREEFPQYDVTVRGAVSIGRRLVDPLAELVKIDPKSIGVGQYQHDVDQKLLKDSLDRTVESCVNSVGVNLNTASKHLLTYISGLGPVLAQNIVDYRKENGAFLTRDQLKKVTRLGPKAFEQAAGFLRIRDAANPLDNTAVHPESYHIVEKMAADLNCTVHQLISDKSLRASIRLENYVSGNVGLPTLTDIMHELEKPGLDPRQKAKVLEFAAGIHSIDDLHEGMELPGIITNITNFGAFVDIGIKQNGLIHISNMADRFIKDPNEIVKIHQHVSVRIIGIDKQKGRIQLSLRKV